MEAMVSIRAELQHGLIDMLRDIDYGLDDPDIYEAVPQDAGYPYITVGDIDYRPWQVDDSMGYSAEARIHVHSDVMGRFQVNRILDRIEDAVNRGEASLDLGDYVGDVVTIDTIFSATTPGPDGVARSGRVDFRILITGED
jgi:hypothetical protein